MWHFPSKKRQNDLSKTQKMISTKFSNKGNLSIETLLEEFEPKNLSTLQIGVTNHMNLSKI